MNQEVLRELATHLGWSIELVDNGQAALDALSQPHRFDAVLMDCQMPVLDGYEATRAIRALEQARGTPPIPIIAVTAHALSGERDRVFAVGMNGFVTKPIDEELLRRSVEELVRAELKPARTG